MKHTKTIVGIIVLIAVAVFAWIFIKGSSTQQVSKLDTTDTVVGFYTEWLASVKDSSVSPDRAKLAKSPILSKALREKLSSALKQTDSLDPVLCQTTVPESFATRSVYQKDTEAQILVTSRDKSVSEQTIVTLNKTDEGWYINNIECSPGEFAPEKEFTFENEGFLLKDSIPAPYNKKNWHIVFEEDGVKGNVVPLIFDKDSQCTDLDGNKAVCKPDQLAEATKVLVRGQMTEYGANVKQLQLVKE